MALAAQVGVNNAGVQGIVIVRYKRKTGTMATTAFP